MGPKEDLDKFWKAAEYHNPHAKKNDTDNVLSCKAFFPYPQKYADLDEAAKKATEAKVPWNQIPKDGYN